MSNLTTFHSTIFSARQFMHDHTIQIRGDAFNLRLLRQSNQSKYERMKQQNVMILNLRKSLLKAEQQIIDTYTSSSTVKTASSTSSPSSSTSSSSSSSRKLSNTSQSSASLSSFTRPSLSFSSSLDSEAADENTEKMMKKFEYLNLNKKDWNRMRIMEIYLKAIEVTQKLYRKVMTEKAKDNLIKATTLPVITFAHNEAPIAYGLVKYPDRLLHAANLEDYLDRCLAKQQLIISEATTKIPPSISFNMLPSSPHPHPRRRNDDRIQ